jgi:hypothetical protein
LATAALIAAAGCSSSKSTTTAATSVDSAATQHSLEQARAQDRATQSDLRNAMTAEKTIYTDEQAYDATPATMKAIESSLDWGGALTVVVGDAMTAGDQGIVCLNETSKSGTIFAIGDVSFGPKAGTYYGMVLCPEKPTAANIADLGASWDDSKSSSATTVPGRSDEEVQSDLRNALAAEKVVYVDSEKYDATAANMRNVEPSLDWGGKLKVSVGDAVTPGDAAVVCMSEKSSAGSIQTIADVAAGPHAGTFYGLDPCPAKPTPKSIVAAFGEGCPPSKPDVAVTCTVTSW